MYRIFGALSTANKGGIYAGLERFVTGKTDNHQHEFPVEGLMDRLSKCRLIFLGEIHSERPITAFQKLVLERLTDSPALSTFPAIKNGDSRQVHVVMEHFAFDQQHLLEEFCAGNLSFAELNRKYLEEGNEGHDLEPYKLLLDYIAQNRKNIKLHAGFVPKKYARQLIKEGEATALLSTKEWFPVNMVQLEPGSAFHYNFFESLLTGRSLHSLLQPTSNFKRIFRAQLFKDVAMAEKINRLIQETNDDDIIIAIAGNGHMAYYQGVPERVLASNPDLVSRSCLITSHGFPSKYLSRLKPKTIFEVIDAGPKGANPADFLFVYGVQDDGLDEDWEQFFDAAEKTSARVKDETREAYENVGSTAHLEGNLSRAHAIMKYLKYSDEEIRMVGSEAYNFQGVGNPHKHAKIQPGEMVLDLGSGLGIDSTIAARKTGLDGRVIGVDLSEKQVRHAQSVADKRELDIRYLVADMERLPFPDNSFDVVISNGAFCLAPNKEAAFTEIYRVLKPGGRMSVCTTTLRSDGLDGDVEWPLCMQLFVQQKLLLPMCQRVGFSDVVVDDTDSAMVYELELPEEEAGLNPDRRRVHIGGAEFQHLEMYNMDNLCARVCVSARKRE